MKAKAPDITISNACLAYAGRPIFDQLQSSILANQWTGLLGQSGIGKSSFLKLIAGLIKPAQGVQASVNCTASNGIALSQQLAYMSQNDPLLPWLSVLDNVLIGPRLRHETISSALIEQAHYLLNEVNLSHAHALRPAELSGGMRQRVALARTLLENQPVVLMDEPFAALDIITKMKLHDLAVKLLTKKTVLFVTHDPFEALRLSSHLYIMAGKPLRLYSPIQLTGHIPRDLTDPTTLALQKNLLHELESVYMGEK